ncbi:MAG: glycerol-3-phosphate dehydrogenase, partial [Saprospiraceae bacterium]|nr:glycerol-3-phosphate dehydrogenase [Saprospiraceae bacterium]
LCCTALDLFNRRTGRLYFDHPGIGRVQQAVLQDLAEQLNWSAEQLEAETAALERAKAEAATFE